MVCFLHTHHHKQNVSCVLHCWLWEQIWTLHIMHMWKGALNETILAQSLTLKTCCPVINPFPVCILNESLSRGFSCVIHNQDQLHITAMYDYNITSYRSHAKKYQSVQLIILINLNVTSSHQQLFHVHLHVVAESVTVHTKWFIQISLLISMMMKWACRQKEFHRKHQDHDSV